MCICLLGRQKLIGLYPVEVACRCTAAVAPEKDDFVGDFYMQLYKILLPLVLL